MKSGLPLVHAVTNPSVLDLTDFTERAASMAEKAWLAVHVRSRSHGARRIVDIAAGLRRMAGLHLFVNDRVDVARAISAHGIHLPSSGIPTRAVRNLVGEDMLIGRSTHSAAEALAAHDDGADYVFLGPIWPTQSHPGSPGIGIKEITRAGSVPVIAIGGVTPDRVLVALDAGAHGVAAISAIWESADPAAVVERMLLSFQT